MTTKGGTHVTLMADQMAENLITTIEKKNNGAKVKPAQIKNHMWIFVNALMENPTFDIPLKGGTHVDCVQVWFETRFVRGIYKVSPINALVIPRFM